MRYINLSQNQVAIVDDADFEYLNQWKWTALWSKNIGGYYAVRNMYIPGGKGKYEALAMHRVIMGLKRGDKLQVDHKNGRTLDNQRHNLRIVSNGLNQLNRRVAVNNTSGHAGIRPSKTGKGWYARLAKKWLGTFPTIADAKEARRKAILETYGDEAV